ncbi:hypothetical protein ENBRE01_2696 [Enteropsectra breve]|nr:hypothetical protein ENBRE01_2696 [Enteropsectra breve]
MEAKDPTLRKELPGTTIARQFAFDLINVIVFYENKGKSAIEYPKIFKSLFTLNGLYFVVLTLIALVGVIAGIKYNRVFLSIFAGIFMHAVIKTYSERIAKLLVWISKKAKIPVEEETVGLNIYLTFALVALGVISLVYLFKLAEFLIVALAGYIFYLKCIDHIVGDSNLTRFIAAIITVLVFVILFILLRHVLVIFLAAVYASYFGFAVTVGGFIIFNKPQFADVLMSYLLDFPGFSALKGKEFGIYMANTLLFFVFQSYFFRIK